MNAAMRKVSGNLTAYLDKLNERDRLALVALALFVVLLMLFYGLLQPASHYRHQARLAFEQERELISWLKARQPAIAQIQERPAVQASAGSNNTLSTINSSAGQFKLAIKRVQPENNGNLRVWLEAVSFADTLKWLHHLEQQGITVAEINLDQSGPGNVNLRATFTS